MFAVVIPKRVHVKIYPQGKAHAGYQSDMLSILMYLDPAHKHPYPVSSATYLTHRMLTLQTYRTTSVYPLHCASLTFIPVICC
jgi:hypothetical protein